MISSGLTIDGYAPIIREMTAGGGAGSVNMRCVTINPDGLYDGLYFAVGSANADNQLVDMGFSTDTDDKNLGLNTIRTGGVSVLSYSMDAVETAGPFHMGFGTMYSVSLPAENGAVVLDVYEGADDGSGNIRELGELKGSWAYNAEAISGNEIFGDAYSFDLQLDGSARYTLVFTVGRVSSDTALTRVFNFIYHNVDGDLEGTNTARLGTTQVKNLSLSSVKIAGFGVREIPHRYRVYDIVLYGQVPTSLSFDITMADLTKYESILGEVATGVSDHSVNMDVDEKVLTIGFIPEGDGGVVGCVIVG